MNSNLPYLMFYKGDFLRGNVSACSIAAQGLWFRLMILMHDSERTGYLCLNGSPLPSRIAAVKCAVSVDEYEHLLAELMSVSAFETSRERILYSPELVAEAETRAANAQRQRKHYEKKKEAKPNANLTPDLTAIQQDKPSSISSSTANTKEKETTEAVVKKKPATTTAKQTDDEFFSELSNSVAYKHVDIFAEFEKAKIWCSNNNRQPTRKMFIGWINRIAAPIQTTGEQNAITQRNQYQPNDAGTRNAQRIDNTDRVIAELLRQGANEQNLLGERDVIG